MNAIQGLMDMPDDLPFTPTPRKGIAAVIRDSDPDQLAGEGDAEPAGARLPSPLTRAFMLAGNAIVTIVSKESGKRFTFKLQRPKTEEPGRNRRPIWISVLSGPQNTADYAYLGTIWEDAEKLTYAHGRKSRVTETAPSARAALWVTKALNYPELFEQCEVWHEGRCGRCARRLTVPSSIASGIGPECARM